MLNDSSIIDDKVPLNLLLWEWHAQTNFRDVVSWNAVTPDAAELRNNKPDVEKRDLYKTQIEGAKIM